MRDKKTVWDGVSNHLALKHLSGIRQGDDVLIYHTGDEKAIVGLAQAQGDAYADPKKPEERLFVVEIKPVRSLPKRLSLSEMKSELAFKEFDLVRLPRLSVMPISAEYWSLLRDLIGF
jgi:predicted RNA-binding protein with PUA-like domain